MSSEKRQRGAVVSMRVSENELVELQSRAAERGVPISTYVRERALEVASEWSFQEILARPGARLIYTSAGAPVAFWCNRPDLMAVS